MSGGDRARSALAGWVAGLAGGLFGVGGGILLIPILTGVFALTQHEAHGTSLAAIGATAVAGVVIYALHGNVGWSAAAVMVLPSILGARWGARGAALASRRRLMLAFAVFLTLVAARLLWGLPDPGDAALHGPVAVVGLVLLGLVMGLLAGFLGIGGGAIAVPGLAMMLGFSQQLAQGTSLALILATAPFGAIEHSKHGNVAWRLVPMLALGAALGAPLASLFVQHLPHQTLARCFAVFLLANAVIMAIRSREPRPGSIQRTGV